jgi:hypothetical protein
MEIAENINYCPVHADREASLTCIRCGRYMCTKCARHTPVGYVCEQCFRQQDNTYFIGTNSDNVIIFAVCAVLTGIGGAIVSATGFPIIIMLLFGLPIGGAVGEAALRLTGRRRTRYAQWISTAGCFIGGLTGGAIQLAVQYNNFVAEAVRRSGLEASELPSEMFPGVVNYVMTHLPGNISLWLFVAIVAFGVYGRYRMRI